jgi:hypothetical protein
VTPGTPESELARDNHYVPQFYFRRWSSDGNKVWSYRTLVSHAAVPTWDLRSIRSLGQRRHLYTSVADGKESDRIETWLDQEVETPAQAVLDRACARQVLTPLERKRLARFIASLVARSPLWYAEHTRIMAEAFPKVLEATIKKINAAAKGGRPLDMPREDLSKKFPSLTTKLHRNPGEQPAVHVQAVIGRENWLSSIEHVVNNLSASLEGHNWQLFRPYPGWKWYTTDHPVIRLNVGANGEYDFKGGFALTNGEILLPLSPQDLLYAQVGQPRKDFDDLPLEHTMVLKRFIAQNAFRWIVADAPSRHAEWFQPRMVSLDKYREEEESWGQFHDEQTAAERELRTDEDPPPS